MVATIFKANLNAIPKGWTKLVGQHNFGAEKLGGPDRPPIVNPGDRKALNTLQELSCVKDKKVMAPVIWAGNDRPQNNVKEAIEHWTRSRKSLQKRPEVYAKYAEQIQTWLTKDM